MFGNNPFNEQRAAQKVQEISKGKLDQYVKGAEKDKIKKYAQSDMGKVSKDDAYKNQEKRNKGIDMAKSKMKPAKVASNESVNESKFVIPEEIPANERTAFHGAAAAAAKAGKSHFNFGGKKHPVTMKKDTAKAIADDAAVKVKGTPRAGNNPFRGGRPTVKTEGIYKDMDTEKSEPSPRSDAKVKADFKKRRKTGEKSDVNMNPKMDGAKDKSAMETKESTIREKLMAVLEGDKAKHYKDTPPGETAKDMIKGKGAEDMMKGANDEISKGPDAHLDEPDMINKDRAKMTSNVKKSPMRKNDNPKGDKNIVPGGTPVKSTSNIKGTMEAYVSMYAPKVEEEIEESYTHEVDYAEDGKHTVKKFVATAKKAGIKAKIHNPRGPGGGHPVVHLGHKDTKHMHKFLKKHYDPDMEHDDLDAHKI
tara:strand:- start:1923 stop:3185 length:1263 start_codon:yes stop_codon:yes gene_type:complete